MALTAFAACSSPLIPPTPICTTEIRFAVVVQLVDSVSGGPLPVEATVQVRDGEFIESATVSVQRAREDAIGLAPERAGTYSVSVRAAGYEDWKANNVTVTRDQCHVQPVQVVARLVKTTQQ